jgi:hypothetical protein
MEITFYKKTEAVNTPVIARDDDGNVIEYGAPFPVMLWKFRDENGNLWNTETGINGTEQEAATIILTSINNGN